ncbi:MAG: hypothetical protein ACRYFX_19540 [Janthinobacterium lividum]
MSELLDTFATDQRQLAEQWLRISIERFRSNLKKLKVGASGDLYNSFVGSLVSAAGGDELRLRLAYAIQGMYVDMGVGRGMGAGVTKQAGADYNRLRNGRGKLLRHERRAKRWYGRQMSRETKALAELYSDLVGKTMIASAGAALPQEPVQVSF